MAVNFIQTFNQYINHTLNMKIIVFILFFTSLYSLIVENYANPELNSTETINETIVSETKDSTNHYPDRCFTNRGNEGMCIPQHFCEKFGIEEPKICSHIGQSIVCCPFEKERDLNDDTMECGQRPDVAAIVGGFESVPNTWPWSVALYQTTSKDPRFICGGAIIDKTHVLTAAHCVIRNDKPLPSNEFLVKLGAHTLSYHKAYREIEQIVAHEKYSSNTNANDIAILKLKYPLEFHPTMAPICLPTYTDAKLDFTGKIVKIIGWGSLSYGGHVSDSLQEVDIPIISNRICKTNYARLPWGDFNNKINNNLLCAGLMKGGKDSCQGDSGGPLAMEINGRWTILGIVSFGYKCAEPGYPGIYTRVTQYIKWIRTHIRW